jgi:hypothetical protein
MRKASFESEVVVFNPYIVHIQEGRTLNIRIKMIQPARYDALKIYTYAGKQNSVAPSLASPSKLISNIRDFPALSNLDSWSARKG